MKKTKQIISMILLLSFLIGSIGVVFPNQSRADNSKNITGNQNFTDVGTEDEFIAAITASGEVNINLLNDITINTNYKMNSNTNKITINANNPVTINAASGVKIFDVSGNNNIEINLNKNINFKGLGQGDTFTCFMNIDSSSNVKLNGNNNEISYFNAVNYGGAIRSLGNLDISGIKFKNNSAKFNGGAIFFSDSMGSPRENKLIIKNTEFLENKSENSGGGVYSKGEELTIENTKFENNTTTYAGGAIYAQNNNSFFTNIECIENEAKFDGGAIYIFNDNSNISNSKFFSNKAKFNGGAIYIRPDNPDINIANDEKDSLKYDKVKVDTLEFENNMASNGIYEFNKEKYPKIYKVYKENILNIKSLSSPADINNEKHLAYNNYDIFFLGEKRIGEYNVIYNKNGDDVTGNVPVDKAYYSKGKEVIVRGNLGELGKIGHDFIGWSTDKDSKEAEYIKNQRFTIEDDLTEDITLYAIWELKKYTLTFESNGGTQVKNATVEYGGKVPKPTEPIKDGYTFKGWYEDEKLINEYDFNTEVKGNMTLYAKWEKSPTPTPTEPEKPEGSIKDITLIGGKNTLTNKVEEQLKNFNLNRISGADRYITSVEVSKGYKSSKTVVLASGEKYTDELTATILANKLKAPVLLSRKDKVPTEVMEEIERLGATKVILIGEKGTLSTSVEKQLSKYTLERIGGKDRYATAVLVGNQVRSITDNKTQAILVDGNNFPDAIAMTSMAVEQNIPILLTETNKLNTVTEKAVKDWNLTKVTIGGGKNSVSESIETTLKKDLIVERVAGSDRYATSVLVAKQVYKSYTYSNSKWRTFPRCNSRSTICSKE